MEPDSNLDWPNLTRYKNQNFDIAAPQENEKRVVFMGGHTTPQMLIRFKQDVVDLMPTVVVILAGTNDIAEKELKSILGY